MEKSWYYGDSQAAFEGWIADIIKTYNKTRQAAVKIVCDYMYIEESSTHYCFKHIDKRECVRVPKHF